MLCLLFLLPLVYVYTPIDCYTSSAILLLRALLYLFSYSFPPSPLIVFPPFSIHLYLQMDSLTHLTLEIIAHTLTTHQVSQVILHLLFYFLFFIFRFY